MITPTTIAARLAAHLPALPAPTERAQADGGVWYKLSPHVGLTVTPGPDDYVAHIASGRSLGLACDEVASVAATPEAAVADAIRKGDHILAAAALASAQHVHTLSTLLGTSLPTTPLAARERVVCLRKLERALNRATEAAQTSHREALNSQQNAETMIAVDAALPGLTDSAHADRVAILRELAPSGWHKVNGNRVRWLQGAGLVELRKRCIERGSTGTKTITEASITDAGRLALRSLTSQKPTP